MTEPFLGEVKLAAFDPRMRGWAFCDGQLLPINQNQALFALLGTTYGGNGQTTFALPDLRGRVPMHRGNTVTQGQRAGQEVHTLTVDEIPTHTHDFRATTNAADTINPEGALLAATNFSPYIQAGGSNLTTLDASAITAYGGSQAHNNTQPYLVLNFMIALIGIFPSRN